MAHLATPPHPELAGRNRAPAQLWLPHWSLSQCVRAVVSRSTVGRGRHWPEAWCYNHFPASPLCSVSWFIEGHAELLDAGQPPHADSPATRLPQVYFAGPMTRPTLSRNSREGHGMMLMLQPDAAQALTGVRLSEWVNRIEPLEVLGPPWQALGAAVLGAPDDAARVALIEAFLMPRWQAVRAQGSSSSARVQDWLQGLAQRAAVSGVGRSLRQVERRIKGWTGLPLRELRGFGRSEQAFFQALSAGAADTSVPWAEVADAAGYADQSHLSRETRRVTGFPPEELRRRIAEDESFWIYRIWI